MRRILPVLLLLMLAAVPAGADSLSSALDARARLGPDLWSRVLRLENDRPGRPYPARFHALVFELSGLLWFYTDTDGTQSLSRHRGRLAQEKAGLLPLLQDIEPGIRRFTDITDRFPPTRPSVRRDLPHGCFVDSVAYYLGLCATGRPPDEARLLSYYFNTATGRKGHSVLLFRERGRLWFYDSYFDARPHPLSFVVEETPLAVATAVRPPEVGSRPDHAVYIPLRPPEYLPKERPPPTLDEPATF